MAVFVLGAAADRLGDAVGHADVPAAALLDGDEVQVGVGEVLAERVGLQVDRAAVVLDGLAQVVAERDLGRGSTCR